MNKNLQEAADAFNRLYPVGTPIILINDFGEETIRKVESKAWVIGDHSVIALFEGITGGYNINRVKVNMVNKTNSAGLSYLVPGDAYGNPL